MAYITKPEIRPRLPKEGAGISDGQIEEAIASAVAYVSARTGDSTGDNALAKSAASKLAQADLLDLVFARDTRYSQRDLDSPSEQLRQSAERDLTMFDRANPQVVQFPDMPPAYVQDAAEVF